MQLSNTSQVFLVSSLRVLHYLQVYFDIVLCYCVNQMQLCKMLNTNKNYSASVNYYCVGDDIDHLISYSMSWTLEEEVGCARKYGSLRFWISRVIKEVHEGALNKTRSALNKARRYTRDTLYEAWDTWKVP